MVSCECCRDVTVGEQMRFEDGLVGVAQPTVQVQKPTKFCNDRVQLALDDLERMLFVTGLTFCNVWSNLVDNALSVEALPVTLQLVLV